MSQSRRGFTLVEILVVAVLGGLLVLSTYSVLITNQRTYTTQNAKIEGQQITRAALDALASELREVNPIDLITMGNEQVTLRAQRGFALTCAVTFGVTPTVDARQVGDWLSPGDSVFIFADNQVTTATDDAWILARVSAVDTTQTCAGEPAQRLSFAAQQAPFLADSVRAGAPVRAFDRYTYGRFDFSGESWIGRAAGGGSMVMTTPTPLIGPIPSTFAPGVPGVEFIYLDSSGAVTGVQADVAQIELRVRTKSDARSGTTGAQITDSLVTRIQLRN